MFNHRMHVMIMKCSVPPPTPRSTAQDGEVCSSTSFLAVNRSEDRVKILAKVMSNTRVSMLANEGENICPTFQSTAAYGNIWCDQNITDVRAIKLDSESLDF